MEYYDNNNQNYHQFNEGYNIRRMSPMQYMYGPATNTFHNQSMHHDKKKDPDATGPVRASQAAFLGPQIWDKTLSLDLMGDFKDFELEYMDLDEFFNENTGQINDDMNNLATAAGLTTPGPATPSPSHEVMPSLIPKSSQPRHLLETLLMTNKSPSMPVRFPPSPTNSMSSPSRSLSVNMEQVQSVNSESHNNNNSSSSSSPTSFSSLKRVWSPTSTRCELAQEIEIDSDELMLASTPGDDGFDPKKRAFSVDELRPQPVMKKSKKVFVPDPMKDDRYWCRRTKNNVAAKRSRDARRVKENQIALRAGYLERENEKLVAELAKARSENGDLRTRLSKYENT